MVTWIPGRAGRLLLNPSVRLNIVAPVAAYWTLSRLGMSTLGALAVSAAFPAAGSALAIARHRRLDPVAALSLAAVTAGLAAGLLLHNGRLLLVKEALITGTLGVAFLASLLAREPLTVVLRRRLAAPGDEQPDIARAEAKRTTAIWGVALLFDAAVHIGLSYLLPAATMVTISPLVAPLILGPVALWTRRPRARRRHTPARGDR